MVKAVAPLYGTHRYVEVLRHLAQENAAVLLSRLLDGLWKHGEELQCVVIAASPGLPQCNQLEFTFLGMRQD